MAEIVLHQVVKKAIDIASSLAIQESIHLSGLKQDINWIESEIRYIQTYLEDADHAQYADDRRISSLVSDIRCLGLDVEEIMDRYFPKLLYPHRREGFTGRVTSVFYMLSNLYSRHQFTAEIQGIRERVNEINRRRKTYGIQETTTGGSGEDGRYGWDPRRSYPHVIEENIVSLQEQTQKLVSKLVDGGNSELCVVSIIGMAGVGKTTLAKTVYKSVAQMFQRSAWICVSQKPNTIELLQQIARQVGLEKAKWGEHGSVEASLFEFLLDKRYVLIIDDIWELESWDALKIGIPTNSTNGSRIILTSRNRYVGVHVGGQGSIHELKPLDPENSINLFSKLVRDPNGVSNNDLPPQLHDISNQILKKCGGVPLAIVLTAGMLVLRERTECAWKEVLEGMGQEDAQCSKIFALSFKDLPTKLKPCFLYFGIFPEDYEISASELINLWAAEGFISGNGTLEVEDVGENYLSHLVARNLIQVEQRNFNGRIKTVTVHDILHSLCLRIASEINFFHLQSDITTLSDSSSMRVLRVSTHGASLPEHSPFGRNCRRTPKLHTITCFSKERLTPTKKHVKKFVRDQKFLRVFHQEGYQYSTYLPNQIGNLNHLTYLRLKVGGHAELPHAIINLQSLLTLDVHNSHHLVIPNCIWKMTQLRHLLLSEDCIISSSNSNNGLLLQKKDESHPIEASSQISNLQNLYGFSIHSPPFKYLFPQLTSLRKLGLFFKNGDLTNVKALFKTTLPHKLEILRLHNSGEEPYNLLQLNLRSCQNLLRLHLEGPILIFPMYEELPPNLVKLTLVNTQVKDDIVVALKQLPQLKILKFGWQSYMGDLIFCANGFPRLQTLEINRLFPLKELIVRDTAMPQLNKLTITSGATVTTLPYRIRDLITGSSISTLEPRGDRKVRAGNIVLEDFTKLIFCNK